MPNTGGRVYEDVQPKYTWVAGENIDLLVVDLTGFRNEAEFKKEHVKLQIDDSGRLKVSGERPLGGGAADRWSRFEKVFRMSEDCVADNINAKLDSGLLLVMMPKMRKDQPPGQAVSTPTPPAKPEPKVGQLAIQGIDADFSEGGKPGEGKGATVAGGGDEQKKEANEKEKHEVTSVAATDDRTKASAGVKEEARGQPEADTWKTPESPARAGRKSSEPPPTLPPPSGEAEQSLHMAGLRRWPRQELVNVLVAVIVLLVGLAFYLGRRG